MSEEGHALSGDFENGAHRLRLRVYYEDTDFSGVVYHANYLRYLERGRTDYLRLAGVDQSRLHAQEGGLAFVVRRMNLDFAAPARMDDVLVVETRVAEARGASLTMRQRVLRGDAELLSAEVLVACIRAGRAARIPPAVLAALRVGD
ncbi:MAG: tol-pal system-associated acyl-CoA thioesterase [Salinarimonadaceae bacterium]|nr:MAG: tol-pal system-associated acyl-CoA thioesterase [Salinarimonadaceae bacterium]